LSKKFKRLLLISIEILMTASMTLIVVACTVTVDTSYGKPCKIDQYSGFYGTDGECHVCPSSCSAPAGAENVSGEGFSVGAGVCCYWVNCSPYECQTTE